MKQKNTEKKNEKNNQTNNETKNKKSKKRHFALNSIFGSTMILGCVGTITFGTLWCSLRKQAPTPTTTYTVTFDLDGGSIPGVSGQAISVLPNTTYGMLPTPQKNNYVFIGYTNNGTLVVPDAVVTSNVTLKANWEAEPTPTTNFKVTFDLDGGTIPGMSGNIMNVAPGTTFAMLPKPTKDQFSDFECWLSGGQKMNPTAEIITDLTVKASWIAPIELNTIPSNAEMEALSNIDSGAGVNLGLKPSESVKTSFSKDETVYLKIDLADLKSTYDVSSYASFLYVFTGDVSADNVKNDAIDRTTMNSRIIVSGKTNIDLTLQDTYGWYDYPPIYCPVYNIDPDYSTYKAASMTNTWLAGKPTGSEEASDIWILKFKFKESMDNVHFYFGGFTT